MRFIGPCLAALAIVAAAVLLAIYRADRPPKQVPTAPAVINHIADYHWVPEGQHGDGDYQEFLDLVEQIQQQQMAAIRKLDVREVWVEGQSDETIDEFRQHVLKLRDVKPPPEDTDNPVEQLRWHRQLIAQKWTFQHKAPGRPPIAKGVAELVVKLARENPTAGYDRLVGMVANLGHQLSDNTVKTILKQHGLEPAPPAQTSLKLDSISKGALGNSGSRRLLHDGGLDPTRPDHVLRAVRD